MIPNCIPIRGARGFTLIEVLVALIVAAVGLLGLAKMQALSISATKESGSRSLIALQAGSLAAVMYANEGYWTTASVPTSLTISGIKVVDSGSTLSGTATGANVGCTTTVCSPAAMAAVDVQNWAFAMNQLFPTYSATVQCQQTVATTNPSTCAIYITWSEKQISVNSNTAIGAAANSTTGTVGQVNTQSFSIYVNP